MARSPAPWFRLNRGWFVTIDGKQVPLGVADPDAEAEAVEAFRKYLQQTAAAAGKPPPPLPKPDRPTVAGAVGDYLAAAVGRLGADALHQYRVYLRKFAARFGKTACDDLRPDPVESWSRGHGWSQSTRAYVLAMVRAVMRSVGWPHRLRVPRYESAGADSVVPPDVWAKVLAVTEGDFRQLLRVLWGVGCRPQEAAGLTAADVDLPNGVVRLKAHKTSGKIGAKLLYLTPDAAAVLAEQVAKYPAGLLFRAKDGKKFRRKIICDRLRVVSARVGRRFTAKMCRHTFATNALAAGVPEAHVAALLGHTSTAMVSHHYGHVSSLTRLLIDAAKRVRPGGEGEPPAAVPA